MSVIGIFSPRCCSFFRESWLSVSGRNRPSSLRTGTGTRLTKIKTVSSNTVAREYVEVMKAFSFVVGWDRNSLRMLSEALRDQKTKAASRMLHCSDLLVLCTRQILFWIHGLVVDAHFVMQVRTG